MYTQIVSHQNKFITRLHSCIFFIFLDIRVEACSFTKNESLNRYFSSILSAASPVRAAVFKNTSFSQNTPNGCISCFSYSIIQKIIREPIKLETAYLFHDRCHYLHIYSQLGTLKKSEIKLSTQFF